MTPPDHDDQPLDDGPLGDDALAVNAVVDDEATPEQRRRVARDPVLVAQVAALREAIAAVAGPVEPPAPDVLAALRQRALDAAGDAAGAADDEPGSAAEVDLEVAAGPPPPVRDLAAARARRTRSLPPLPAVAAVVVLLVLVGVGLLVAGTGGEDQDAATTARAEEAGGSGASSDGGDAENATEGDAAETEEQLDEPSAASGENVYGGPSDETVEELRRRATASYATEADLLGDLGRTDPETLALPGSTTDDQPPATTTQLAPDDAERHARSTADLAADPVAQRCDVTLRAGEPELDAATGAALVEVDGIPVLVLRTPVEPTDRAPLGIRLTALTALDCSPLGAVVR